MTQKELNDLRYMRYHIKRLRRRIAEIESAAFPKSPSPDRISGGYSDGDVIQRTAEYMEQHKRLLESILEDYEQRKAKTEAEIYAVTDELIKAILIARFIEVKSWRRVAYEIGGGNTEDSVRMLCMRFLARH